MVLFLGHSHHNQVRQGNLPREGDFSGCDASAEVDLLLPSHPEPSCCTKSPISSKYPVSWYEGSRSDCDHDSSNAVR